MTAPRTSHPAASWRPDLARLLQRLEEEVRRRQAPWPEVAASALLARGVEGCEQSTWAARLRIQLDFLQQVEAGSVAAGDVPPPLAARCHAVLVPTERTDDRSKK